MSDNMYRAIQVNENRFDINEVRTNSVLKLRYTKNKANKICEMLNEHRSGFNGWTPSFFAETLKEKK